MSNNTNLHHKNYQTPIQRLAIVIRDTLEVAENTIFIGRENLANQDFNAPVISIEQSGNSEVKGFSETYRRNVEVMEYSQFANDRLQQASQTINHISTNSQKVISNSASQTNNINVNVAGSNRAIGQQIGREVHNNIPMLSQDQLVRGGAF
ncbi:hypothetical protein [Arsenophonus nasoniae]|uniref:Uncharacterized protein n=1 Tax=Arsenophonus nasoniae TaxID=638 RepID=A0A4P7L8H8_9GAMM|nr:hypothetical protein [Arsenophonus nasoniae]QBY46198.1 hypothetical protein ArsFIN_48090 [Arsenophonus nasoniae]